MSSSVFLGSDAQSCSLYETLSSATLYEDSLNLSAPNDLTAKVAKSVADSFNNLNKNGYLSTNDQQSLLNFLRLELDNLGYICNIPFKGSLSGEAPDRVVNGIFNKIFTENQ